jgi:dTDP-4-dehydrorhamnose 3,5-epimerase-like enzyme
MPTITQNLPNLVSCPITELTMMDGGVGVDDRGQVSFVNGFDFQGVKRFYLVRNHKKGFIRAWHAHKLEGKYVSILQGSAIVGAVKIVDFENPDKNAETNRFIMSASKPSVLAIPPGYANGAMTLTDDAIVAYFSTTSLGESEGDDYRLEARYWDIWSVEER